MKRKKVLKSLADLSADSIGSEAAKSQDTTPPEAEVLAKALLEIHQPDSVSPVRDDHGFRHWGINE